jgi:hypothetical protein
MVDDGNIRNIRETRQQLLADLFYRLVENTGNTLDRRNDAQQIARSGITAFIPVAVKGYRRRHWQHGRHSWFCGQQLLEVRLFSHPDIAFVHPKPAFYSGVGIADNSTIADNRCPFWQIVKGYFVCLGDIFHNGQTVAEVGFGLCIAQRDRHVVFGVYLQNLLHFLSSP